MRLKRVTCPETAHLETIEIEDHPLGILIAGCSRFTPESEPACSRCCAELLDRRGRARPALGEPCAPGGPDAVMLASLEVSDPMRIDLDLDACAALRRDS